MEDLALQLATAGGIILAAIIISWIAGRLLNGVVTRFTHRTKSILDDVIVHAGRFSLRAAILVYGVELAAARLTIIPEAWEETLARIFFLIYAVLIFVFLYRLLDGLVDWYDKEISHQTTTDLDDKFITLFRQLALLALTAVVLIMILDRFGIEVNALITSLGIASLAVALAAQDTLGNMFAGLSIMVDQPFAIGDRVEILDINTWGDVREIGLRSTRILTRDNRTVTIPNSVIGQGLVVNYSLPENIFRVETHVGIAYGSDIEAARQVMIDAIRAQDWVMQEERIEALFLEFGDSALIFRVRCWIEHYIETRRIMDKMNSALYHALNEAGIVIPFPQREVHLLSGAGSGSNGKRDRQR